jgi:hypothetical protein
MGMAATVGAAFALMAIARLAGPCSGDDGDGGGAPARAGAGGALGTAGPATTTISPEEEVEAAYLAFWDMFVRLAQAPDPDDPEIHERASGEAAGNVVDGLTTLRSLHRRSQFGPGYRHEVLQVDVRGDTAVVQDCAVDDSRLVDTLSGEVVAQGVVTELLEVTLQRVGDTWLVDGTTRLDSWSGAVACG